MTTSDSPGGDSPAAGATDTDEPVGFDVGDKYDTVLWVWIPSPHGVWLCGWPVKLTAIPQGNTYSDKRGMWAYSDRIH